MRRIDLAAGTFVIAACFACSDSGSASPGTTGTTGVATSTGATGGAGPSTGSTTVSSGSGGAATTSGSTGGSSGSTGTGGSGGGGPSGMTNGLNPIPPPPGPANVPKPAGSAANLKVLAWGGFKSALTYTFDDSEPSQVDHWPDLKATGIPVTFYITTSNKAYKGYDAAWKEALSRGNELGNHTVNHCGFKFENCDNDHLATPEAEVDQCTDYLKSTYGVSNVWTMAYPFGDTGYEPDAQSRFFMARGISDGLQMPGGLQVPGDYMDPFDLVIKGLQGDESAAALNGFIDDAHNKGGWLVFLFHTILPDDDIRYAGVDVKNIVASVTHTKSLSDVWIDTVASVGAYWVGQTAFQATPPTTANGTTTWTWKLPAHFPPKRALRVTVGGGTLKQGGTELVWDPHGYYEVMLDAGSLTWSP